MQEYITDALVLDMEDSGELDCLVCFFTTDLGKVIAKAKSLRKITSKLAGQIQPLSIAKIRLVEKNGVQLADAILIRRTEPSLEALELVRFIKEMTFEFHPDKKLWLKIKKSFEDIRNKNFSYKPLLEILGFAPDFAECRLCKDTKVKAFSFKEHVFLCEKCLSKVPKNELILF